MASPLVTILVILLVIAIIIIVLMLLFFLWLMRKKIIRDNLTYNVQQGTSNSNTDIFELETYDIYICNRTPITITMSGGGKNMKGRLYYISNLGAEKCYIIAGYGLTILQGDNWIDPETVGMYVFMDNDRILRIL